MELRINRVRINRARPVLEKFTLLGINASSHDMDIVDIFQPIKDLWVKILDNSS